jgi:hypothetical protein
VSAVTGAGADVREVGRAAVGGVASAASERAAEGGFKLPQDMNGLGVGLQSFDQDAIAHIRIAAANTVRQCQQAVGDHIFHPVDVLQVGTAATSVDDVAYVVAE